MKVLLDIDGVLGNFYKSFAEYLNEKYNAGLDLENGPVHYDYHLWGHNLSDSVVNKASYEWAQSGKFLDLEVYPNAKGFVDKLKSLYDVYIVTARVGDFDIKFSKEVLGRIIDETKIWLNKHGIGDEQLFFRHDKIGFCKEYGISVLIEDKYSTAKKAVENDIYAALNHQCWNSQGPDIDSKLYRRCHSYDEILDFISEIKNG